MEKKRIRLRPEVIVLSLAAFFNDAASEMIYPLLPLFITTQLGGTAFVAGAIEGVADAIAAFLKYLSGAISDRLPTRKPLVVSGYGLAAFSRVVIAAATVWPVVLVARMADRVGKGIRGAPRDAIIADVTPPEARGRAFGLHRSLDHAGAVIGPLVAAGLMGWFAFSLRAVFFVAIIPAAIGVLLLLVGLREPRREISPVAPGSGVRIALPSGFKAAMIPVGLFALANSSDVFLLIQASRAGVATAAIPLLWSAHHVLKALLSERAGALSDRIGRRTLMIVGWLLYAAVYLVFPFVHGSAAFFALFVVYALPFALTEGAEKAWVINHVDSSVRGRAFGIFHLTVGVCTLLGTLLFGALYETAGALTAFAAGAALALAATVAVAIQKPG